MSIKHLYEDERPTLLLDFANSKTLDPRITCTRNSTATYVDEAGIIKTAAAGEARFDHDPATGESIGLLIEESRTNSCLHSEDVTVSPWTVSGATVTANATTAPDGTSTADAVFETSATGQHYLGYAVQPFQNIATSIFVKPNGRDNVALRVLVNGGNWATVVFNLTGSGSVTQITDTTGLSHEGSSIIAVGNGWYRISLTTNYTSSVNQYPILVSTCTSSTPTLGGFGAEEFAGDVTKGVYVWGAQFEYEEGFPTSYIPTSGSTVTRNADQCVFNDSNIFAPSSGTFIADATLFANDASDLQNEYVFLALAATDADSVSITAGQTYSVQVLDSSIGPGYNFTGLINYPAYTKGVRLTTAAAYAPGPSGSSSADVVYASDGAMRGTNTGTGGSTTPTGMYQMYLFRNPTSPNSEATGYLHKLAFYPTRLPNSALEALTE